MYVHPQKIFYEESGELGMVLKRYGRVNTYQFTDTVHTASESNPPTSHQTEIEYTLTEYSSLVFSIALGHAGHHITITRKRALTVVARP